MVFHIPVFTTAEFVRIEEILELAKNHARGFFDEIGKHIEPAAVGHAHHDLLHARGGAFFENRIEGNHERLAAFEGEAFLADEFRVDERLEGFGLVEGFQHAPVQGGIIAIRAGAVFDFVHHPLADFRIVDVFELRTERGAVSLAKALDHLPKREGAAVLEIAGRHHLAHLGLAETECGGLESRIQGRRGRNGIQMRASVADCPIGAHEFVHPRLERRGEQARALFLLLDNASFEAELEALKKGSPIGGNRAPVG